LYLRNGLSDYRSKLLFLRAIDIIVNPYIAMSLLSRSTIRANRLRYIRRLKPESLTKLVTFAKQIGLELKKSSFTLDSGFDSRTNKDLIKEQKLVPVIKANRRNTKELIAIARMYRWFSKEQYKERYKVERTFGWQDTYRRLAISYDRLEKTRLGFRHLAYAMIDFRITFNCS